jgi:hypothetical protein
VADYLRCRRALLGAAASRSAAAGAAETAEVLPPPATMSLRTKQDQAARLILRAYWQGRAAMASARRRGVMPSASSPGS